MSIITVTNTADSGTGSLRQALKTVQDGDTIKFDASLANKKITLTSGQLEIKPGKNITIDGADATNLTLSGNDKSRVFYINSNQDFPASLTVKNLIITDGYTSDRGGAIYATHKGEVTVDNVQFKNNVADKGGGAIYTAWETTLTVTDSKFDHNEAVAGNDERGGGAIAFLSPGALTVKNSEFTKNKGINGGAINSLQGKLTIENSKFIDNSTTSAYYDTGEDNAFLRGYGGAVYTDRASSTSESNGGTIQISNSVFDGNKGRGEGGAAYLYTATADKVVIEDSLFENNEVLALPNGGTAGHGGAVVQLSNGLNKGFTIRNSTFADNTAAFQGGGLWTSDTPTDIINSTFSGNKVTGGDGSMGGGMALYSPTDIEDSTIAYNESKWFAGGVAADKDVKVTVKDTIFYKNTADNQWGTKQQTNRELTDLGGNYQYPPKASSGDINATAKIETSIDPELGPLQDNGGLVPTHAVGNPDVGDAGASSVGSGGSSNQDPLTVAFSSNLESYGGSGQDKSAQVTISDDKTALQLEGNTWKKMGIDYTITADTVLKFDFRSTSEGEIQGIGFDNDNQLSSDKLFQLSGTQDWGISKFDDYVTGSGWKSYEIPVGDYFTGEVDYLTFANDHDVANPTASSEFRNIQLSEVSAGVADSSTGDINSTTLTSDQQLLNLTPANDFNL
ncbi:MAG TPA: right-handed parallel beta-helix repeat-containing protein [Cyanophyceae cyanobacterium]